MVGSRLIRHLLLPLIAVTLGLVAVACEAAVIPATVDPGDPRPGSTVLTGSTETPATSTPEASIPPTSTAASPDSRPTPSSAPSPEPEVVNDQAIPEHFFDTLEEAQAEAEELGCSGWKSLVEGTEIYFRPCADDAMWEAAINGEDLYVAVPPTVASTPDGPQNFDPPVSPDEVEHAATPIPTPTPAPKIVATPPPHYYETQSEAEIAAAELGCSGWAGKEFEGKFYFRACGDPREFELLTSGATKTLSGEICELESDATARFVHPPTDIESISAINPPGSPIGGVIKPHSYIFNKDAPGRRSSRVPVYAVADSVLTAVSYYGTSLDTGEYLIFFDVTCEISFKYDHLSEVVPKIAAFTPDEPANSSATTRTDPIEFKAGEIIGYSVGAGGQGPWDFGAYDTTYTNKFANQERYVKGRMSQSLHTVCPYEYFVEPYRTDLLALLGTHGQEILPGIPCFTSERDVVGALAGAWFDSQDVEFSDSVFSAALLAGDFVGITGIGGDMRIAKGEPTWIDPADVTGTHCYHSNNQWYFVEIQEDGMTMKAAGGSGNCPATLPSDAQTYYR